MSGVHCERFPTCMVLGIDANIPACEETGCPGRIRRNIARTIAVGLLEPRTNAEVREAIDGVLMLKEQRNEIFEEAAREAETFAGPVARNIAAAIRAMKDKP